MDWIQNLISYCETSNPGKCPVCGSEKINVMQHENGERKSVTFVCANCKATDHFDGTKTNSQETTKPVTEWWFFYAQNKEEKWNL